MAAALAQSSATTSSTFPPFTLPQEQNLAHHPASGQDGDVKAARDAGDKPRCCSAKPGTRTLLESSIWTLLSSQGGQTAALLPTEV